MLRYVALAFAPLALLLAGTAPAGKGGPSPGVMLGWDGTLAPTGVRYVALPAAKSTTVAAVRTSDGRVLRFATINGVFGIPLVAFDGTTEGISPDGETLVLADAGGERGFTRFAVLQTRSLRLEQVVTLPGVWSYDALSPDGRMLYAVQYLGTGPNARYKVRAVSLVTGKPVGGAIVDPREPEGMSGAPYARARSRDGAWAYTLYAKPNGTGFIHALDTARRRAICIDLPWRTTFQRLSAVRLSVADDGRSLVLAKRGGSKLAVVDTSTFRVTGLAKP